MTNQRTTLNQLPAAVGANPNDLIWISVSDGVGGYTDKKITVNNLDGSLTSAVTSVNGFTGAVQLNTDDIPEEPSALYFTDARAQAAMTGAISNVTTSNLTVNRAVVSGSTGKLETIGVTTTELGYVAGVTSGIQTQLNVKQASNASLTSIAALSTPASDSLIYRVSGGATYDYVSFGTGMSFSGGVLNATVGTLADGDYVDVTVSGGGATWTINNGVVDEAKLSTSVNASLDLADTALQTATADAPLSGAGTSASHLVIAQASGSTDGYLSSTDWNTFNNKAAALSGTANEIAYFNSTTTISSLTTATYPSLTELSYVKGVTSAIQTQLNAKQSTITFGTGVQTALGVNIGSAGAPVLFNGAGGTPSSITLTNATGTAASLTAGTATNAVNIGTATESSDTTCFPVFVTASGTQTLPAKTNTGLTYNSSTNNLGATTFTGALSGNATTATTATTATNIATASESADTTCFITFVTSSGTQSSIAVKTNTGLTYNSSTNNLGATTFTGALSGNATTATTATTATNVTVANEGTDTTCFVLFATAATGDLPPKSNASLTFNSNTGALASTSYTGSLASATGLPISTGVTGLGTNVATFLATPSSANLAAALTDETGSGSAVFGTAPTISQGILSGSLINQQQVGAITLVSGVATFTEGRGYLILDTEGGAATDDLDSILQATGSLSTGQQIIVKDNNSSRDITFKHGTGNILCQNGVDFTITIATEWARCTYDGTNWRCIKEVFHS